MKPNSRFTVPALLALLLVAGDGVPQSSALAGIDRSSEPSDSGSKAANIIHVPPPTGDPAFDRPNIEAAIAASNPGDEIRFGAGTYVIGLEPPSPGIVVDVAGLTLIGSPEGTTIRGGEVPPDPALFQLGLRLHAPRIRVARLGFEDFSRALDVGTFPPDPSLGGFTVEGSRFEHVFISIEADVTSEDPTRIVRNLFVNVGVAILVSGGNVRFAGNVNVNPNPALVPISGQPLNVGGAASFPGLDCLGSVFENNVTDGNADGLGIAAFGDSECGGNIIRNNAFTRQRLFTEFDAGTMVTLVSFGGRVVNNLVTENTLDRSEGNGMLVFGAERSRIFANTIRRAKVNPLLNGSGWGPGGTGILVGVDARENRIADNTFSENEHCDVVLRRRSFDNLVDEPEDRVRDAGTGNIVFRAGGCARDASVFETPAVDDAMLRALEKKILLPRQWLRTGN